VSSTTDAGLSYYSFPWRKRRIASKWLQYLRIAPMVGQNKKLRHQLRVCSQHFSEACYDVYPPAAKGQNVELLKILAPEAVPDRNLPREETAENNFDSGRDKER
jgi:hypothetical protein